MDDKDWLILKTIHKTGSLTKAAKDLYISQPALTYRLQCLEKEFGTKIFDRHPNGIFLTEQGEHLTRYAENMLQELQKEKNFIQQPEKPLEGTLRLGISTVFAKFKFAPLLKEYKKRFPHVNISIKTGSSTLVLPSLVERDEIDIAILRGDLDWPGEKHVILEEPWCLIYAHPIKLKQLPGIPWILDEASATTKSDLQFYLWWQDHFNSSPPSPIWVNSIEASMQLVSYELGWGIVPKIYLQKSSSLFSSPLLFENGKPILRKTIMIYKTLATEQVQLKSFVDLALKLTSHSL